MKLKITLITLCCIPFMQIRAQSALSIGPEAGFTLSHLKYKEKAGESATSKLRPGFHCGLSFNYRLSNTINLQAGFQYAQLNTRSIVRLGSVQDDYWSRLYSDIRFNSMQAPLLIQWSPCKTSRLSPYVFAGGQIAYLLGMTENYQLEAMQFGFYEKVSGTNDSKKNLSLVNTLQFSATLGAGLRMNTGSGFLNTELCYRQGINKIGKNNSPVQSLSSICMNIGYFFHL